MGNLAFGIAACRTLTSQILSKPLTRVERSRYLLGVFVTLDMLTLIGLLTSPIVFSLALISLWLVFLFALPLLISPAKRPALFRIVIGVLVLGTLATTALWLSGK